MKEHFPIARVLGFDFVHRRQAFVFWDEENKKVKATY